MLTKAFLPALSVLALAFATTATAETGKTPPGDPCRRGNGNPCGGNNGNSGDQGNANKERVKESAPGPMDVPLPAIQGRGAFIAQIGEGSFTSVEQSAPDAYVAVRQDGAGHRAEIVQTGAGQAYVNLDQRGSGQSATVRQDGAGQNVLYLSQDGGQNRGTVTQNATGAYNAAVVAQRGIGNEVTLVQDGEDNRAILNQDGDANRITATQNGVGNRLEWTQQGSNLSDLGITQSGAQAIRIIQSGVGK